MGTARDGSGDAAAGLERAARLEDLERRRAGWSLQRDQALKLRLWAEAVRADARARQEQVTRGVLRPNFALFEQSVIDREVLLSVVMMARASWAQDPAAPVSDGERRRCWPAATAHRP